MSVKVYLEKVELIDFTKNEFRDAGYSLSDNSLSSSSFILSQGN